MVVADIADLSFIIAIFMLLGLAILTATVKYFECYLCYAVAFHHRTNVISLQTLLHFNIGIGVTSSFRRIRLKYVAVMFILTVQNTCTVNDLH
jgi:galactose-1-phosphate uridylyltransferase